MVTSTWVMRLQEKLTTLLIVNIKTANSSSMLSFQTNQSTSHAPHVCKNCYSTKKFACLTLLQEGLNES